MRKLVSIALVLLVVPLAARAQKKSLSLEEAIAAGQLGEVRQCIYQRAFEDVVVFCADGCHRLHDRSGGLW